MTSIVNVSYNGLNKRVSVSGEACVPLVLITALCVFGITDERDKHVMRLYDKEGVELEDSINVIVPRETIMRRSVLP